MSVEPHWDDPCVVFDGTVLLIVHDALENTHDAERPCDHCLTQGWDGRYWDAEWDKEKP